MLLLRYRPSDWKEIESRELTVKRALRLASVRSSKVDRTVSRHATLPVIYLVEFGLDALEAAWRAYSAHLLLKILNADN